MYLVGVPLLVVPFAIYNIVAFLMPGVSWNAPFLHVTLRSGADWPIAPGDVLLSFAILLLLVELVKLTRLGVRTWVDHTLSFLPVRRHDRRVRSGGAGRHPDILPSHRHQFRRLLRRAGVGLGAAARAGENCARTGTALRAVFATAAEPRPEPSFDADTARRAGRRAARSARSRQPSRSCLTCRVIFSYPAVRR